MENNNGFNFADKRNYILLATAILLIIAIWGYAFEKQTEPVRVAFETKGGAVLFDHMAHTALDIECSECHHDYSPEDQTEMNCRSCHYSRENTNLCPDASVHKRCIGENCSSCHISGSVECGFCHNVNNFKAIPEPELVEFDVPMGLVEFNHSLHASPEELDLGCEFCHHRYNPEESIPAVSCRRCHYNTKYESLCEDNDIHLNCIGATCVECHTDGEDDCSICHQ